MLNLKRPTLNLTADDTVESFHGPYRFLSNFYPCDIRWHGMSFPTLEHAFQAAKCSTDWEREMIRKASTPGQAKRLGRRVNLRSDWEDVKLDIMWRLLCYKFRYEDLKSALLATGDAQLIEGNDWHDYYWGVCNGVGENHLGKLLMRVRKGLRVPLPSNVQKTEDIPYGDGYGSGDE
jgi:ribA/ribD-fused uncharacterized protein